MTSVFEIHHKLYSRLCGVHPRRFFWHSQWLSVKDLYRDLKRVLPNLTDRVLDVGCRDKPYAMWLTRAREHVGIDIVPGPMVDHLITEGHPWPLADESFRAVICTQVLMHSRDVAAILNQIDRVLCTGGSVVITVPFCYNDLSCIFGSVQVPDYWRFSAHGAAAVLPANYEVVELRKQGGVGSTLGVLLLNWLHSTMASSRIGQILFVIITPLWIVFSAMVNLVGLILDKIDRTGCFYHNVLLVARKKSSVP